jgi:uncharacterized protein YndB with AHSA1/START domain
MSQTTIQTDAGLPLIYTQRRFEAPPDVLLRAYTEPALIERWLGPRDLTMTVERYEVRDGGRWRYVARDGNGDEFAFHGVFHGDPSLAGGIVQTLEFDGEPGRVSLDTYRFEADGDGTIVTSVTCFQSVEDRDRMVASGMERGVRESAERLAELLVAGI